MAYDSEETILCISANGKTTSSSRKAARRMLVATTEGVLDFRRDGPAGAWLRQDGLLLEGQHVSCLVYDEPTGLLFAGMHFAGGLLKSADGGKSWQRADNGVASGHAYTLLVQHVGGETILNLGTEPVMFYRSWDLGESWTAYPSCTEVEGTEHWIFPRAQPHIKHIAAHPDEPETIYICVEQGDLLRTTDGGKSWESLHSMERSDDKFRRDQHRVVFYRTPDEIFFTTGIGLYHSADKGATWERLTDTSHPCAYPDPFFVHPTKDVLFMQGAGENPNPKWATEGTAHPQFMKSIDHGKTWQQAMAGMVEPVRGNLEIAAMHDAEEGGLELYTGSACGELYVSRDEGESWQFATGELPPMSKGPHFRWFLTAEEREAYENKLRGINAFA
ncbi:WD40/YVTN/BNR-like repeat-containing protein [Sphingomonas canadensis]|uniref:WD40/YVTN/BNR-like repeat-containing protein n=1 Tax=Sphingomonas canadensis TaxID=1219257 RepID=A0ABW3HEF4_9SPHN|nr:glycosyl hydrolase [Sphingomonas canadensis]MCW3838318.1 glycosyl hydrolase [Sphingomonas canadensis]